MFQIVPAHLADLLAGWTGANPYGMARVTLAEHVCCALAVQSDEYVSTSNDGAWSAIVALTADESRLLDFCEAVDSAFVTTPNSPYPWGTFETDHVDFYGIGADRTHAAWAMLADCDERGWLTYSIETAADADATWSTFVDSLPCLDEFCEGCDRDGCEE